MADAQAAVLTATNFLQTKVDVLSANSVPLMDECAICLESYISLSCLTSLLATNPTQEKKCPICRTVWIPAPVPPSPLPGASTIEGWASVMARAAGRSGANANDVNGPRTVTLPSTRAPQMVINIDSDSDDGVTEESFEQYRQEIADIRSRARNGRNSWRQREKDARERNGGGNGRSNQAASLFRAAVPTTSQSTRHRSPIDPVEALMTRNWRNASPNANANNDNDIAMLAPEPAPAFSRLSPSPQTVGSDQLRILNERTKRVDEREEELRSWERRLNERERDLHKRDQALFVREQRVAQRERKKDEFVEMKQRQLDELRAMAQRHQEEVRRA